ncbi:MAG: isoprenyl transferase [Bdellovibrionota bacterium]
MLKKLQHIAIIMDGNGRWAQLRGKPRTFGHIKGARVAKKIITQASDLSLKNLTLYAFSSENWLRPQAEVAFLMKLLTRYLKKETVNLHKKNIRFNVIGEVSKLPVEIQKAIIEAKELTKNNTGLNLSFALSYSSRRELVLAAQSLAKKVIDGKLSIDQINEKSLSDSLMTAGTPDPDLIIRTSGESRLSNFLMWQASYSELFFSPILWPDYSAKDFHEAIQSYLGRERRFGKVFSKNDEHFL